MKNEITFTPDEVLATTKYDYQAVSIKAKPSDFKQTSEGVFTLTRDLEAEYTQPIPVESVTLEN